MKRKKPLPIHYVNFATAIYCAGCNVYDLTHGLYFWSPLLAISTTLGLATGVWYMRLRREIARKSH